GKPKQIKPLQLRGGVSDVAKALDFIHSRGSIHRDIKPDNILFDKHQNVFVSDFGIVKAVGNEHQTLTRLTGTGVIGTPGYIAPEILLGQEQDGRLDQYSLAITVFVLVAGRPVFEGSTAMSILARQINEPAPDLHDVRPALPRVFTDVVMRGLKREPEDRFSDSRAFAEALEESLHVFAPVVKKSVPPPLLGSAKPPPITQSEHPADAPASTAAYPVFNEPPFVEPIDEEPVVGELIDDEPIFGEPIDDSANA
ncbi:MAG: serine/threonine protein kinase, partial [Planctomycetes bacterium]|nr:serine/threonine protein kinase [Planctomycetota bacterium]